MCPEGEYQYQCRDWCSKEQPIEKMAHESCRLLLEHLADDGKKIEDITLRGEIVMRESV